MILSSLFHQKSHSSTWATPTPLAFIDSVTTELLNSLPEWYCFMYFQLPYLVTVFSQAHTHGFPFSRYLDSPAAYNYHVVTILTIYTLPYPDHHGTLLFSLPPFLSAVLAWQLFHPSPAFWNSALLSCCALPNRCTAWWGNAWPSLQNSARTPCRTHSSFLSSCLKRRGVPLVPG